jgi:hypothetical protein
MHYSKVSKLCKHCGIQLKLNNMRDIERKNFCSRACRQRWRYEHGDSHFDAVRHLSVTPESIRKRNLPKGPKTCAYCGRIFDPNSARQRYCKTCVPDKSFHHKMLRYKISKPDWDSLIQKQGGTCALCNNPPYAVDHCHETGEVRGLLCDYCNRLLGKIEADHWANWYVKAKAYLD